MTARQAWALVVADFLLGASLAFGLARAHADPYCMEDQPCWSCVDDGNRICGPDNPQGVPPGLYDEGGLLAVPWQNLTHHKHQGGRP